MRRTLRRTGMDETAMLSRFLGAGRRAFSSLTEQEILALAISSEEDDSRIYLAYADGLRDQFPDSAKVFEDMAAEESEHRRRLIELLKTFKHTKVIATHDLDMAVDLCERTIVIYEGSVTADGPTLELLQDEVLLAKSGLEKPLQMQNCPVCGGGKLNDHANDPIVSAPRKGLQPG